MERARNRVLDCPLCGHRLKSSNSRQVHVKKCGRQYNIPSDQVLARVREQEQEHTRLLDAGILPPEQNRRGRPKKTTSSTATTSTARPTVGTVHRLDEDTALAIALSTSLKEEELRRKRTSIDDFNFPLPVTEARGGAQTEGNDVKDAFSVLMSQTPAEKVNKRRKKKGPKHVPLLLVQSALEGQEKLARRLAELILPPPQVSGKRAETPKFKSSAVVAKYQQFDGEEENESLSQRKLCPMWKKTALLPEDESEFYVSSLQPHVNQCTLQPGSKIKTMHQIPGWKPLKETPEKPKTANETMLVSTQTAVLLAELADGNLTNMSVLDQTRLMSQTLKLGEGGLDQKTVDMINKTLGRRAEKEEESRNLNVSSYDEQPSGFFEEQIQSQPAPAVQPMVGQLQQDLSGMVDNSLASDVTVRVGGDEAPVSAHSFILAARAPILYKAVSGGRVDLSIYSRASVLAVLSYLYAGHVTAVKADVLGEMKQMADRFQLKELAAHCSKMAAADLGNDLDLENDLGNEVDSDLQQLLRQMWGSDDEDSSEEEEEKKEEEEEEEMDDLYSFFSQRQKKGEAEKTEEEDSDNEEDSDGNEDQADCNKRTGDNEKTHNSRLSSGALDDLLNDWAEEDENSEKDSTTIRDETNESDEDSATFDTDNCNAPKLDTDISIHEKQNETPAKIATEEVLASQNSPIQIESDSDPELEQSGSDLFNSLTPQKSVDDIPDSIATPQEVSPSKSSVDMDTNDTNAETVETGSPGTDIASSPSPVFATQKCRERNTEAGSVSVNLLESFEKARDIVEEDVIIVEDKDEELGKKRKRNLSSKTDDSRSPPKRARPDDSTARSNGNTTSKRSQQELSPVKSKQSPVALIERVSQEALNRLKHAVKSRLECSSVTPTKLTAEQQQREVRESKKKEVSHKTSTSSSKPTQEEYTPESSTQEESRKRQEQEFTPARREKSTPKRQNLAKALDESNKRTCQDEMESPVFHKRISSEKPTTTKSFLSNDPDALVDLTQEEEEEEGAMTEKRIMDTASPHPGASPRVASPQSICDVFEGYEEPEAYQEEFLVESPVMEKEVQSQRRNSSDDEEMLGLKPRFSNHSSTQSPARTNTVKDPETITPSQEYRTISSLKNKADELFSQRCVDSKRKSREEKGTASDERREEKGTASDKRREEKGTASDKRREEKGTAGEERREAEVTANQKSRKFKKFQFKSQKSSQSQRQNTQTKPDTPLKASSKASDISSKASRKSSDISPKTSTKSFDISPKTSSKSLDISPEASIKLSNLSPQVSKYPSISSSTKSSDRDLSQKQLEVTFGSEDDGVLNMVMDEMEGTEGEEFDPPTDVSMNMDATFGESSVHPNLLKTPAVPPAKRKKPLSEWQPPSPFTPMPQYDSMKTPDLKKQCSRLGVRALPKKKMLGLLKDIYTKTHQYETDPEYEQPSPAPAQTDQSEAATQPANQKPANKTKAKKKTERKTTDKEQKKKEKKKEKEMSSDETDGGLNTSFEEKSSGTDVPEESMMCSPTSSPISKRDVAYKQKLVWDYIQAKEELYIKILHYEPLELDDFHQELKTNGISLGKQILMDFLDEKCVVFSLRGSRKPVKARGARSPRKRGRGSPKKPRGSPKKPRGSPKKPRGSPKKSKQS